MFPHHLAFVTSSFVPCRVEAGPFAALFPGEPLFAFTPDEEQMIDQKNDYIKVHLGESVSLLDLPTKVGVRGNFQKHA